MERSESLEEGLLARPSVILEPEPVAEEIGDGRAMQETEHSSVTPVVLFSTWVAIFGSFGFGCSAGYSSPAEAGIMADLELSLREYAVFAAVKTVGGMIGALINGKIADLIGRRGIGVGLSILQPFGGSIVISYYASSIFAEADLPSNIAAISMAIIQIPAVGASALLTDKFGRRPLLLASSIGSCLSLSMVALAFGLQDIPHWKEVTPVLVYIGIMVIFPIGMLGLPSVIMSEIFPINIKGTAGSLVTLVHYSCDWIVAYSFSFMIEWSITGTFWTFASCLRCTCSIH
ncbi:Sugar transporter ERD6-like protein [Melia azedarach]|uniref:Sugar transporter ERD6-like protein n=1 Tax=Melia azedarach TaxID=155640 RepID=A0ACC1Y985_MELAZ|nr:Sugar transporter ERD6-like protein [Melia azedarach]